MQIILCTDIHLAVHAAIAATKAPSSAVCALHDSKCCSDSLSSCIDLGICGQDSGIWWLVDNI